MLQFHSCSLFIISSNEKKTEVIRLADLSMISKGFHVVTTTVSGLSHVSDGNKLAG